MPMWGVIGRECSRNLEWKQRLWVSKKSDFISLQHEAGHSFFTFLLLLGVECTVSHGAKWSANFWGRFQSKSSWVSNTVLRSLTEGQSPSGWEAPAGHHLISRACRRGVPQDQQRENPSWEDGARESWDLASGQPNAP